jgi:hypothetical protein
MRLGGIKFSEQLARVSFELPEGSAALPGLLAELSKNRLNLSRLFLCPYQGAYSDFCIDHTDFKRSRELLHQTFAVNRLTPIFEEPVGTITLFPHRSDIHLLLTVLETIDTHDLPVYGLYSSISGISLCIGHELLDRATSLLLEDFDLPKGHSPFRYEPSQLDQALSRAAGRKVETVARYWEPQIKIYGSTLKRGLTQLIFRFPRNRLGGIASSLADSLPGALFEMVGLTRAGGNAYDLQLIVADNQHDPELLSLNNQLGGLDGVDWTGQSGLEVLYLHGPHFQDRYGVAAMAVRALQKASVDFLSLNCSGTSIYLVCAEQAGSRAAEALADVFVVP